MDELDKIILTHLEKDARISLKKLAQEMGLKTSTLYHRLHKLSECKTILNFSVILNPEKIGINLFYFLTVELNLPNDPISRKLSENLAEKISNDMKEIFFSAIGNNNTLYMVVSFFNTIHLEQFLQILSSNEYVKKIDKVQLNFIHKGLRMFDFNEEKLMNVVLSNKKSTNKEKISSEEVDLGELVNLDTQIIKPVPKYKPKQEREDNDGMIPL